MRFDWYAATLSDSDTFILHALVRDLELSVSGAKPKHGYELGHKLAKNGQHVATLYSGGANEKPSLQISGQHSPELVDYVRNRWQTSHHVTRLDVAQDYDSPNAFQTLTTTALTLADDYKLKVSQAGDWHRNIDGRTLYIGSRKSPVFLRIYEKGKQLISENSPEENISSNWVRVELEVKPQGSTRSLAAFLTPSEVFGYSDWSKDLAARLWGLDVPRTTAKEFHLSDDEKALFHMVKQYKKTLTRLSEKQGSWQAVGEWIEQEIKRQETQK